LIENWPRIGTKITFIKDIIYSSNSIQIGLFYGLPKTKTPRRLVGAKWFVKMHWLRSYQTKRTISSAKIKLPVYLQFVRQQLVIMHGQPPYNIRTAERITERILREAKPKVWRPSPIDQATEYARVLSEPSVVSKSQVAQRFGVSRVRVHQMLNLLNLDDSILEYLGSIKDADEHNYFTEHRLRRIASLKDSQEQIAKFNELSRDMPHQLI